MKFACDSCGTKYSIADERVRGRVLKIRCKKCDFVITVREDVKAAAAVVELPRVDELASAFDPGGDNEEQTTVGDLSGMADAAAKSNASSGDDDWYVSFDGEQEGPFSLARALERVRAEQSGEKEAHAWRPGFLVWLPVEEVPELAASLKAASLPKTPVRATAAAPIAPREVPRAVPKDPSGPRAALGVSAAALGGSPAARPAPGLAASGAAAPAAGRLDLRKTGAPPIPASARAPGVTAPGNGSAAPSAKPSLSASLFSAPAGSSARAAPAPKAEPTPPATAGPGDDASVDLPISNEASGLVNIAQLAAAAMGKPTTGPAFINGHTGRMPKMNATGATGAMGSTGRQPAYTPEALDALEPQENMNASAPVVVMAGAPQGGTHAFFKWAALGALVICLGLGGGVAYLLTHRKTDTIIVTEPSRHTDDSPITMTDPVTGKTVPVSPEVAAKHANNGGGNGAKKSVAPKTTAPGKGDDGLSGSQKALANLYNSDVDDHGTPHGVPTALGAHATGGGQASNAAIIAVVGANKRTLSLCYERALKHDQSLKSGRVPIQVSVGMSGRVTAVSIPEQQYASSELGQCFVQAVKHWNFPASDGAYTTEFPFILQAQ